MGNDDVVELSEKDVTELLKVQSMTIEGLTKTIDENELHIKARDEEIAKLQETIKQLTSVIDAAKKECGDFLIPAGGSLSGAIAIISLRCATAERALKEMQEEQK